MIIGRYLIEMGRNVFIPFRYDSDSGTWVSLVVPEGYFSNPIEAAQVCLTYVLAAWMNIVQEGRVLRALCEHPEFEFHGDSVDASMIRESARAICEGLEKTSENFHRMLDSPNDDDVLHIQGQKLPGLEPFKAATGVKELTLLLDCAPDVPSPDDRFLEMLKTSWGLAHERDRVTVTSEGIMRALAWFVRKASAIIAEEDAPANDISQDDDA